MTAICLPTERHTHTQQHKYTGASCTFQKGCYGHWRSAGRRRDAPPPPPAAVEAVLIMPWNRPYFTTIKKCPKDTNLLVYVFSQSVPWFSTPRIIRRCCVVCVLVGSGVFFGGWSEWLLPCDVVVCCLKSSDFQFYVIEFTDTQINWIVLCLYFFCLCFAFCFVVAVSWDWKVMDTCTNGFVLFN